MAKSKREMFTPGPGVVDMIEEFMEAEKYTTKSGAINRMLINFHRFYKAQKEAANG